jgi:hypothetical protein
MWAEGVDTRALTKTLRETGTMLAKMVMEGDSPTVRAPFILPFCAGCNVHMAPFLHKYCKHKFAPSKILPPPFYAARLDLRLSAFSAL